MNRETCFQPADILIPQKTDLTKWSVIACDQYTSQPEYWKRVEETVGDSPSSYRIIFPEVYLNQGDTEARIQSINQTMQAYLDDGLFQTLENRFVYVERQVQNGRVGRVLLGKIDLTQYDYHPGAQSLVRATEKTVLERIPPRVKIRENAPLEIPHIMLLIDDPERTVIEPAGACKTPENELYRFPLMLGGGEVEGYAVPKEMEAFILSSLARLADPDVIAQKYHAPGKAPFVFAVGDGNHSLASAKACFEQQRAGLPEEAWKALPSRYALVELVNLHDESLEFEPIHRVVFGCKMAPLLDAFFAYYPDAKETQPSGQSIGFLQGEEARWFTIPSQQGRLGTAIVQEFLDHYLKDHPYPLDYIHGQDVVGTLAQGGENVGILLPDLKKTDLFQTVLLDGSLPRKTFSMGSADEKRFYLEARRIQ